MQIVPMKYNPFDEDSIKAVMAKANVVINLIGSFCFLVTFSIVTVRITAPLDLVLLTRCILSRKGLFNKEF